MSWLMGRGGAVLLSAALCVAAGVATFRFGWVPLVALAVGVALAWWSLRVSPLVALAAATLCVVPPGVLGESSVWLSLAALAATTIAIAATAREGAGIRLGLILLLVVESGVLAAFGGSRSYLAVGVLYLAGAWLLFELGQRPALTQRILAAIFSLLAIECVSAVISYLTGFREITRVTLKYRQVELYAPFTLATGKLNAGGWWTDTPRFTAFAGEPGLAGVLLLLGLAYYLSFTQGRRRQALIGLLLAGCILTQSTTVVFALIAFAVVYLVAVVAWRLTLLPAVAVIAAAIPLLTILTDRLLAAKARANPLSVSQRGIFGSTFQGDISLSAALHHHPALVVPLLVLLAYLAWLSLRHPLALGTVAAFGVIGYYAEPLQYHPGAWILLTLLVTLVVRHAAEGSPPPRLETFST